MGVTGRVGSGKSSLLAAITAEMRRTQGQVISPLPLTDSLLYILFFPLQIFIDKLDGGFGLVTQVHIHVHCSIHVYTCIM